MPRRALVPSRGHNVGLAGAPNAPARRIHVRCPVAQNHCRSRSPGILSYAVIVSALKQDPIDIHCFRSLGCLQQRQAYLSFGLLQSLNCLVSHRSPHRGGSSDPPSAERSGASYGTLARLCSVLSMCCSVPHDLTDRNVGATSTVRPMSAVPHHNPRRFQDVSSTVTRIATSDAILGIQTITVSTDLK